MPSPVLYMHIGIMVVTGMTGFHLLRVKSGLTEICENFSEYQIHLFIYLFIAPSQEICH